MSKMQVQRLHISKEVKWHTPFYNAITTSAIILPSPFVIPISQIRQMISQGSATAISAIRHPEYQACEFDWLKWRSVYESGDQFINRYTKKFSRRESPADFERRKSVTPIPGFAKSTLNEIKNSIFQRMTDVKRNGGPQTYLQAVMGKMGGVNRRGATMAWFIGHCVLPEMLAMRKVGVYTDNEDVGVSIYDKGTKHPYLYTYKAEDILSWSYKQNGSSSEFQEVLLRDWEYKKYDNFDLPSGYYCRFRRLFIANDGYVHVQFYDEQNNLIGREIALTITEIPFKIFEITESLLKDVANHQIALLNLESSDMSYALLGNFPLYVEMYDPANNNQYLKRAQEDNRPQPQMIAKNVYRSATTDNPAQDDETDVGTNQGRRYPKGMEQPNFIAPPSEPLEASMKKQEQLKADVRQLMFLALSNVQSKMASAESKALDQTGLESGLSAIGLELEHGEQVIAKHWAAYENSGQVSEVHYPKLWSLKSEEEQRAEVTDLAKLRTRVPSITFQKEITKQMAITLVGCKISDDKLQAILKEINESPVVDSDPVTLIDDFEAGFVTGDTASQARGYGKNEFEKAKADTAERQASILAAQTARTGNEAVSTTEKPQATAKDPGAAGVPALSIDPKASIKEKVNQPTRGPGK